MIPVYVIVLEGSERFSALETGLKSESIPFQRVAAIDGKKLTNFELDFYCDFDATFARLGYKITPSRLACALSHKRVYELAQMANHDLILVLEEDAILQPNFATEIEKLVETFTLDIPTICQLFTRGERFVQSSSLQSYSVNRFLYQFASIPGQTVAYLINRLAIDFALRYDAIAGPPDWPNWASSVDFKGVYPFLVTESELGSSIGSPDFSRWKHWMQLVSETTLKHFFRFHKSYHGFRSYYKLELLPLILRLRWRLNGRQTMPAGSVRDNLWLV